MLRSTIHLPPIEEGEFLLCYVKLIITYKFILTNIILDLKIPSYNEIHPQ